MQKNNTFISHISLIQNHWQVPSRLQAKWTTVQVKNIQLLMTKMVSYQKKTYKFKQQIVFHNSITE
jgi:hypothetical protein